MSGFEQQRTPLPEQDPVELQRRLMHEPRDAAMRALEERLEQLPGLEKWFVDIAPAPA